MCQANHRAYLEQTSLLTNQPVFDHDDSVNNRETGGRLETAFLATSQIWTRKFKEVQPLGTAKLHHLCNEPSDCSRSR